LIELVSLFLVPAYRFRFCLPLEASLDPYGSHRSFSGKR